MNKLQLRNLMKQFYADKAQFSIHNTKAKALNAAIAKIPKEFRSTNYLMDLVDLMSNMPILKNKEGKVSATLIMEELLGNKNELNQALLDALSLTWTLTRSKFFSGGMLKYPVLASLTPLAMYALKRDKGLQYEEWDKDDLKIKPFLGKYLADMNTSIANPLIVDGVVQSEALQSARDHLLGTKPKDNNLPWDANKEVKSLTARWSNRSKWVDDYGREYLNAELSIFAQTWLANVECRNKYMILDFENWDTMPKAFDEASPSKVLTTTEIRREIEDKKDFPWDI